MKLWLITYSSTPWYLSNEPLLARAHGVMVIDRHQGKDDRIYGQIRDNSNASIVAMHQCNPAFVQYDILERLCKHTRLLSLGVGSVGEFHGYAKLANRYVTLGDQVGFSWCPAVVPLWVCKDIHTHNCSMGDIVHNRPYSFSLGHYGYWSYMHEHAAMKLEFNLDEVEPDFDATTIHQMKLWVDQCGNMVAGGGMQEGIDAGSMDYADSYGFTGVIVRPPVIFTDEQMARFDEAP